MSSVIIIIIIIRTRWSLSRTTRMKVVVRARNQFSTCVRTTSAREWTETTSAAVAAAAAAADVQLETLAAAAGHTDSYVDRTGRAGCVIVDARVEFA